MEHTDRHTQTDTHTHTDTHTQTDTHRQTHTLRQIHTHTQFYIYRLLLYKFYVKVQLFKWDHRITKSFLATE